MPKRDELLQERGRLERLIGTCNSEAWKAIEKMAEAHKRLCEHTMMVMDHGNFQQAALDAAFTRGEHRVWAWLMRIRETAPVQLAEVERKLAASEKENADGKNLRQTGKEQRHG